MQLTLTQTALTKIEADLLLVPVASSGFAKDPLFRQLDESLHGELARLASQQAFTGKSGQVLTVHTLGKLPAKTLRIAGLEHEGSAKELRALAVSTARCSGELKLLAVLVPSSANPERLRALAEGLSLGDYHYAAYLSGARKPGARPRGLLVLSHPPTAADQAALTEAAAVTDAVNFARDLVNCPPNHQTSTALAEEASRVARELGIGCTVWDKAEIAKRGMSLLLAVNAGSDEEPRFIHMVYAPKSARPVPRLVFVGKGLIFDAGGLTIKSGKSMEMMKSDMAGGAVTIAIVMAAARLGLPVEVHGIVPCTDNMLGGKAFKPGDVYRSLGGKTVEVLDTDAEGRLILADALVYARKLEPTVLIDHGTLTGDSMAALGRWRAALFATDDALRARYLEAATRSGEALWPLPLDDELRPTIESPIADLKNTGDGYGGSIAAALFLREFVADAAWIHLDIAGPAFLTEPHDVSPKGGTGFGVRTAVEFIKSYA